MEEELMFMIKNDLCEMKYNDFPGIEEIKMFQNLEGKYVVSYKYDNKLFVISSDRVD